MLPRPHGRAKSQLIEPVTIAADAPRATHDALTELLGTPDCLGALTSAAAVASAFADLGRPLGQVQADAGFD